LGVDAGRIDRLFSGHAEWERVRVAGLRIARS
jgi:hypothetical protein